MTVLGNKIKILLLHREMTQKELADQLQVSQQLLSSVLHGTTSSLSLELKLEKWIQYDPRTLSHATNQTILR
jgi:transcriptional regulator with XRE-family HTH domain